MDVIKVTEDHIPMILEIEKEAFSPPWTYDDFIGEVNKEDSCFVAVINKAEEVQALSPVLNGYALLRTVGDDGELLSIAVCSSKKRLGVGNLLMSAVLDFADKKNCGSVFLEVRISNNPAIELYTKHGFKQLRIRRDYYEKPVEDAIVMVRKID